MKKRKSKAAKKSTKDLQNIGGSNFKKTLTSLNEAKENLIKNNISTKFINKEISLLAKKQNDNIEKKKIAISNLKIKAKNRKANKSKTNPPKAKKHPIKKTDPITKSKIFTPIRKVVNGSFKLNIDKIIFYDKYIKNFVPKL